MTVANITSSDLLPGEQPTRKRQDDRGPRDFDKTSLHEAHHGRWVHRDYAAHYFRWGWATRLIKPDDQVLDIGCGPDLPLANVLSMGGRYVPQRYVGIDLNQLSGGPGWAELHGETNIFEFEPGMTFTKVVAFEVIEHMPKEHGVKLLEYAHGVMEAGGLLLLSTPVFNGRAARNHVHEWEIDELRESIEATGFTIRERYGTFASYRDLAKGVRSDHRAVLEELRAFYSEEVTACFLAPLYPDLSRNNAWLCVKEGT